MWAWGGNGGAKTCIFESSCLVLPSVYPCLLVLSVLGKGASTAERPQRELTVMESCRALPTGPSTLATQRTQSEAYITSGYLMRWLNERKYRLDDSHYLGGMGQWLAEVLLYRTLRSSLGSGMVNNNLSQLLQNSRDYRTNFPSHQLL